MVSSDQTGSDPSDAEALHLRMCTRIQHIGATLSGAETSNIFNTIDHPDALRGNPLSTLSEISAHMSTSEPSDEADRARTH